MAFAELWNHRPPPDRRWRSLTSYMPIILVGLLLGYSYYVYVVRMCIDFLIGTGRVVQAAVYLALFHLLAGLFVWCYARVLLTQPGFADVKYPKRKKRRAAVEKGREINQHHRDESTTTASSVATDPVAPFSSATPPAPAPTATTTPTSFCYKCATTKPPRTHHCSICDRCVLRMDHHCPWIAGCVGYRNHRFFQLFLNWACVYLTYYVLSLGVALVQSILDPRWTSGIDIQWCVTIGISFVFGVTLVPFTTMHLYQIAHNLTTLEYLRMQSARARARYVRQQRRRHQRETGQVLEAGDGEVVGEHLWDTGSCAANWKEVMAQRWWLWLFPVRGETGLVGDGREFPQRGERRNREGRIYRRDGQPTARSSMRVDRRGAQGSETLAAIPDADRSPIAFSDMGSAPWRKSYPGAAVTSDATVQHGSAQAFEPSSPTPHMGTSHMTAADVGSAPWNKPYPGASVNSDDQADLVQDCGGYAVIDRRPPPRPTLTQILEPPPS